MLSCIYSNEMILNTFIEVSSKNSILATGADDWRIATTVFVACSMLGNVTTAEAMASGMACNLTVAYQMLILKSIYFHHNIIVSLCFM